jgi:hypothetical protein
VAAGCGPSGLRPDYWTGASTGGGLDSGDRCRSFRFDLAVDNAGKADGWATTAHEWGQGVWEITGTQAPDGAIVLETRTSDPRIAGSRVRWRGTATVTTLTLTEVEGGGCATPRTATLGRRY